jgi:hypothetical protein
MGGMKGWEVAKRHRKGIAGHAMSSQGKLRGLKSSHRPPLSSPFFPPSPPPSPSF